MARNPQPSSADTVAIQAVEAFRAATGLDVCVKLFRRRPQPTSLEFLASRYGLHTSPFCLKVKESRNERCRDCDLRAVPERCEIEQKQFTHVCHAGASEVIIPLFVADTLAAVVYVGQFRTDDSQPAGLRLISSEQQAYIENLSVLLRAYLNEELRTPRFVSESSKGHRAAAIVWFLERHLRDNPSLADLAEHLSLSTTRAAHVVKESTGRSFVQLRDELRLERASELLSGTYHKISHIASECGFSSPQHFHRFFRHRRGMTPLDFRRKQRVEI